MQSDVKYAQVGSLANKIFKISYLEKPLISIITVVYNCEKHIEKTIQSVINQTYDNIEYIIIDGGSTDGTLDIIHKYKDKINYWISEKDEGIYDAMNKGTKIARGNWINFMNAGDVFFDNNVIQALPFEQQYDYIYGDHVLENEVTGKQTIIKVKNFSEKQKIPFCHQSVFVKRRWLQDYPFDVRYKIAADYEQYLKARHNGASALYTPILISIYLDGGVSAVSGKTIIDEYYTITKEYYPFHAIVMKIYRILKHYIKKVQI